MLLQHLCCCSTLHPCCSTLRGSREGVEGPIRHGMSAARQHQLQDLPPARRARHAHLHLYVLPHPSGLVTATAEAALSSYLKADYKDAKRLFEKEYLQQKLLQNDNNISKTAEEVGLERSHLHKKLKSLDIVL